MAHEHQSNLAANGVNLRFSGPLATLFCNW